WLLSFGIISILAGLAAIFWPGSALLAVAIIFGAYLVVGGIFRFVAAFAVPGESGWERALMAFLALISLVVGLYLLRHPAYTVLIVALVLGIYWIIQGVLQLFAAIGHAEMASRGWRIAGGLLSIVAGAIVFFYPGISLFAPGNRARGLAGRLRRDGDRRCAGVTVYDTATPRLSGTR